MTHGLGEFEKAMNAQAIASALGITTNSVYVTRRRVKALLGLDGEAGRLTPKRIIRQESGLELAVRSLEEQLTGYDQEESDLKERLAQIEREKPEIEQALKGLRGLTEQPEREPVAA
jgi:hypothetical protein